MIQFQVLYILFFLTYSCISSLLQSFSEHKPQAACYNELNHQYIKSDSSDQSLNPNSKSAYMFLATQMMCEIGTTLGKKVAAGKLTEKEMYGTAAEYLGKFPSNSVKIDPLHLLARPNRMAALLEPEAREHFENILRVRGTDSITDKCDINKSDRAGDHVRAGTSKAFKEESLTDMCLDRSNGDVVSEVKKELTETLPDPATVEKGEPISKVEAGPVAFSHVSASMIYDEGTDVDTGITERTDIPPDYVFELNEALSPRQKKKQPEKKVRCFILYEKESHDSNSKII